MEHIDALVDDYILGILPEREKQAVEIHIRSCCRCRQIVLVERKRTRDMINELNLRAVPPAGRLEALLSPILIQTSLRNSQPFRSRPQFGAVFTTLALALVVLTGVFGTVDSQNGWFLHTYTPTHSIGTGSPTAITTATGLHTPVQTSVVDKNLWGTPEPLIFVPLPRPEMTAIPLATR